MSVPYSVHSCEVVLRVGPEAANQHAPLLLPRVAISIPELERKPATTHSAAIRYPTYGATVAATVGSWSYSGSYSGQLVHRSCRIRNS